MHLIKEFELAKSALDNSQVIAFPTETVMGLGVYYNDINAYNLLNISGYSSCWETLPTVAPGSRTETQKKRRKMEKKMKKRLKKKQKVNLLMDLK